MTGVVAYLRPFCFFLPALTAVAMIGASWSTVAVADERTATLPPAVLSYLHRYCVECHGSKDPRGGLDLVSVQTSNDIVTRFRRWQNLVSFVVNGEMPPEESQQPTVEESREFIGVVRSILAAAAEKNAGDPGVVLPRRLTTAEFDRSIFELTGLRQRFTAEFPVDPAGGEGFANTGEVLGVSPSLVRKFLSATHEISTHLVLKTTGITFADSPVVSYNERRKLTEGALIRFYEAHEPDFVKLLSRLEQAAGSKQTQDSPEESPYQRLVRQYFDQVLSEADAPIEFRESLKMWTAATNSEVRVRARTRLVQQINWLRGQLHGPPQNLIRSNAGNWPISHLEFREQVASQRGSFKLANVPASIVLSSEVIRDDWFGNPQQQRTIVLRAAGLFDSEAGKSDELVIRRAVFTRHNQFPADDAQREEHDVVPLRKVLAMVAGQPESDSGTPEDAPLTLLGELRIVCSDSLREILSGKRLLVEVAAETVEPPGDGIWVDLSTRSGEPAEWRGFSDRSRLLVRADSAGAERLKSFAERFCAIFPDQFCYVDGGRGLAAGFHLVEGFFRDDRPLVSVVLTEAEREQLDQLWRELDFVTQRTETLLRGFVWFERSEREVLHDERFAFLRAEDPELTSPGMLDRFERLYLERLGGDAAELQKPLQQTSEKFRLIHGFFEDIRGGLRDYQEMLLAAEQRGLMDLLDIAARAWRRELDEQDHQKLGGLYQKLRLDGLSVEESLRGLLTAVLMDPDFLFLVREVPPGEGVVPLSAADLATRLSFFLWGTLPDSELAEAVRSGQITEDDELTQQTARMLRDARVSALATEFPGQWLRYADFPERDPISPGVFTGYDDELRKSMLEEPNRLLSWVIREDRSIMELLNSDRTFLNGRLADHYGGSLKASFDRGRAGFSGNAESEADSWIPVDGLRSAGRGGLPGMAVILAGSSAGERSSAVKRGFWIAHHLLGQHFPPPPADVPELPKSEKESSLPLRELLAAHVEDTRCSMCHRHFDGLGLALEGFNAIGQFREKDDAGRAIDDLAVLQDGTVLHGLSQLTDYLASTRQDEYIATFCRRLLGYALGRSVQLTDEPLLREMATALKENEFRFSAAVIRIVTSSQFRTQRAQTYVAESH